METQFAFWLALRYAMVPCRTDRRAKARLGFFSVMFSRMRVNLCKTLVTTRAEISPPCRSLKIRRGCERPPQPNYYFDSEVASLVGTSVVQYRAHASIINLRFSRRVERR